MQKLKIWHSLFFANIPIALQALLQKHASPPRKFIRTSHHRNTRFQSGFQACLNFLPEKDSRVQWIEARSKIVQISFLQPGTLYENWYFEPPVAVLFSGFEIDQDHQKTLQLLEWMFWYALNRFQKAFGPRISLVETFYRQLGGLNNDG